MSHRCRQIVKWALLLATAGVAIALWIDSRVDDEIRRQVQQLFADQYPELSVTVRSAQLVQGEGIEIRGLAIADKSPSAAGAELAHFDEVFLECNTDLKQLLAGSAEVRRIVLRRPTLRVSRLADGTWNAARLFPLPRLSDRPPPGSIENGVVEIRDAHNPTGGTFIIRDLNLTLTPQPEQVDPQTGRPAVRVAGNMTAEQVRRVEFNGVIAAAGDVWQVDGSVDGLEISPELRDALPVDAARLLAQLGNLRGQLKCGFHVAGDPAANPPLRFRVTDAKLERGRIHDRRLPYPLTDIQASFHGDHHAWVLESLQARNGQMEFWLAGRGDGYDRHAPFTLELTSKRTVLDRGLVELFPQHRKLWDDFLPAGEFDVRAKLTFDGAQYRPEVHVDCRDVSFSYHKFPYRLEYATGWLEYKDNTLRADISAYSAGRQINIDADVSNPGPQFVGRVDISADNLPLDEKLFAAFREPSRHVVRDLNPAGTFNTDMTFWRGPEDVWTHRHVEVTLNGCSLRKKDFPYPLDNIHGRMELDDEVWTFDRLRGRNDSGLVTCVGRFGPTERGPELFLKFEGENIALEDELRDALKPAMRQMWMKLRPQGALGLSAEFHYWPDTKQSHVWVRGVVPSPERSGTTVSIHPEFLPLKLEKLGGAFVYENGRVDLYNVRAENRGAAMSARGHFETSDDGQWHFHLADLKVERLRPDREFIAALPPRMAQSLGALQPTGQVYLAGQLDFFGSHASGEPVRSRWDLSFDLQNTSLDCGVPLDNVYGGFKMTGNFDGSRLNARGELSVDSATFRGVQFTNVLGPFWIDDSRVLFGKWAATSGDNPRRVSADFYGGTLLGDGWIATGAQPRYGLEATISRADLGRLAREGFGARQRLSGAVLGEVQLRGEGRGTHNLNGRGTVRLREADIYQLPLMVQLLSILKLRSPDDTAFTSSDIDFRIVSGRCFLEKVDFKGDAVSLYGQGEMGFDKSINLTFIPRAFRHEPRIPMFRELVRGASGQLMEIHVDGTIDDPKVTRRFLSGVDQAFQQLQADLQNPAAGMRPPPGARSGQNNGTRSSTLWPFSWR